MHLWESSGGVKVKFVLHGFYNAYLVSYKNIHILVDTGRKWKRAELIENLSKELDNRTSQLSYLFLTHTHYDHCDNAFAIKKRFGSKVIVQQIEDKFLQIGSTPLPKGTNIFTYMLTKMGNRFATSWYVYDKLKADILFDKELIIDNTDEKIKLIHTPGHSIGSSSMIIENEFAIVGDTMFGANKSVFPHFADDKKKLIKTWERLIDSECSFFFTGHGKPCKREQLICDYHKHIRKLNS